MLRLIHTQTIIALAAIIYILIVSLVNHNKCTRYITHCLYGHVIMPIANHNV